MNAVTHLAGEREHDPHLIAVRSLVFGTANLAIIGLPPGWKLQDNIQRPEAERWQLFGDQLWTTEGRADYVLLVPQPAGGAGEWRRQGVVPPELSLRIRPPGAQTRASLPRQHRAGETHVSGHSAAWVVGESPRGLLRRRWLPALSVVWRCEQTRRQLELRALGGTPLHMEQLLAALRGCRCHQ